MSVPSPTTKLITEITEQPVRVTGLEIASHAGAECVFVGRTRAENHPEHGPLQHLDYHAYPGMAKAQLRALAERVAAAHKLLAIRVVHATGPVAVGEASVVVQCVAGHRDAAFAACRETIDTLKATLPIWKREVWADGATFKDGKPVSMPETDTKPAEVGG